MSVLTARHHQRDQHVGLQVQAVDEHQRVVGDRTPQRAGVGALVAVGAELDRGQHVRMQRHQNNHPDQRVAADAAGTGWAAEEVPVLVAVCHAQRAAIDTVEGKAAPAIAVGHLGRPSRPGTREQPLHRIWPEPGAGLRQCTRRDRAIAVAVRQRQLQLPRDLVDRHVAQHRHTQHQPHHSFCR
jgi:hypothetical protein